MLKRISEQLNSRGQGMRPVPPDRGNRAQTEDAVPLRPETGLPGPEDEVLYHLGSLLDSVKTGLISLDGEGRIRVFNAVAEVLFGVPRQAVLGRSFAALGGVLGSRDPAVRALWERLTDAVWAAGAALDLEYDLARPKGQRRVIAYSVYPLGRLAWSVGNGVVIMLEDITRKKEMEEQITDGRKRLQNVFDGITDGIQVVDAQFRITALNRSMTALIGGTVAIGHFCYTVCGSNTHVCEDCPAVETFRSGQPASLVRRVPRRDSHPGDQDERILEISTFPLLDRGNRVPLVVEYIKDVTDRVRNAERLEHARRLAVLGEMAARVAHEVRNPLNAITGAAHYLAAEYGADETIRKFTDIIMRQSHRVDQVASDILHAAKPLRLNRTMVDIETVVEQSLLSLSGAIKEQGITVELRLDPALPAIQADEVQVEQAVYNVLKNAVEAMPDGGVLSVGTVYDEAAGWARISVQDTGCGVPAGDCDRIFDAFFTTKPEGTGLGLSIVEGVLKNHGGAIELEHPGDDVPGTRFILGFPVQGRGGAAGKCTARPSRPAGGSRDDAL